MSYLLDALQRIEEEPHLKPQDRAVARVFVIVELLRAEIEEETGRTPTLDDVFILLKRKRGIK